MTLHISSATRSPHSEPASARVSQSSAPTSQYRASESGGGVSTSAAATGTPRYPASKRFFDLTGATLGLVLLGPLMVLIAAVSRIFDGSPVLFSQKRVGLGGQEFTLWKFRSLAPADHREADTRWNVAGDERLSGWGRLLRKTSLDELPQLFNIIRGEMSLVGPRPERPHFVAKFCQAHPHYRERHRMPGGLTGLAQVNGLRGDTSIEARVEMDNQYIDRWSLWLDLSIIARTPLALLRTGEKS